MDHHTACDLIDELLTLKADGAPFLDERVSRNPVAHYVSETRFAQERDHIFRKLPLAAAHSSELARAGSFLTRDIAGRSVLLTRDGDGKVHAFLNVCRHRGTQLVEAEAGCKNRFSCPYHAWTYSNQGALISAPHFGTGFSGLDKSSLGLTRLPCRVLFGLVWVGVTPDATYDFDAFFKDIADDFAALEMENMVIAHEDNARRKANWKILVEGGIEAYHFKIAHRNTIGPYFEDNLSSYQCLGAHLRSILPRASLAELKDIPRDKWRLRDHANVLYTLFPTTQFLVQQDHIVWITQTPLSAGETRLRLATLVPEARATQSEYWMQNHKITMQTLDEDFSIGERIQANLASGANRHMLFGRFEGALDRFNQTVAAYLSRGA